MSLTSIPTAVLLFLQEEGGHAPEKFLGIPLPVWQLVNLVGFLAVLIYFVAKPMEARVFEGWVLEWTAPE